MSDFIARVKAQLDLQQANADMNSFLNKQRKVKIDVDLQSGNVNLNNFLNQIKSQFQSAGQSAGANFANSVNSSLNKINVKNAASQIANLQRTLKSMNFNSSSIDVITKDLTEMDLAVTKITTSLNGQNIRVNVNGIDELGRAVTVVKEFDAQTGRVLPRVSSTITQSFNKIGQSLKVTDIANLNANIAQLSTQFNSLGGSATNVQTKLTELKNRLAQIGNIPGVDKQIAEFKSIQTEVDKLKAKYKELNAENANIVNSMNLISQRTILGNQIQTWMNKNTKAAKIYRTELEALQRQLASVNSKTGLQQVTNQFKELKSVAAAQGNLGGSIFARLKDNVTKLSPLFGMGTLITTSIRGLKDMYQNVLNIDSAMTELKKVTNETASTYENFLESASKRSVEIGSTIQEYVNSTADFARLGYDINEAQQLAEVANIYKVVGDEIASIDVASQSVISTLTAFGIEASEAMSIVDKFNEVGNNFAISSGGIGDALTRSASSMAAANNTLDETIALITAANTVVQDPDVVGKRLCRH